MKKKIGIILLGIALFLCSCGSNNVENAKESDSVDEISLKENENVDLSSYAGTYIGEGGSGLVLYKDGTGDYFWNGWDTVEDGCIWSCDGNAITVYIPVMSCDVIADITNNGTEYVFKSDSVNWDDESFEKTTSVSSKLTAGEFKTLYNKTMGISDEESYFSVTYGGITFEIPNCYDSDSSSSTQNSTAQYSYLEDDEGAVIVFNEIDVEYDDVDVDELEKKLDDEDARNTIGEDLKGEDIKFDSSTKTSVAGELAVKYEGNMDAQGTNIDVVVYAIFNVESNKLLVVYSAVTPNLTRDCSADIEKMIETAVLASTDAGTDGSNSSNTDEVTVSFKEMMDSYEEFMDEYIEFMEKYSKSNNATTMLIDYLDYMQKYADFAEKISNVDESDLSPADEAYYLEVTARVTKKLLEASAYLSN